MQTSKLPLRLFLLCLLLIPAGVPADYAAGLAAYNDRDYETALREFKALAARGVTTAQTNLGYMYAMGEGVEVDLEESARWFRMAAEEGSSAAQLTIGLMTYNGEGMPPSLERAYAWLSIAAAAGQELASQYLGILADQMSDAEREEGLRLSKRYFERYAKTNQRGEVADP